MFLTDFHMQKYTRGIISWVGIFLTVTPAANKSIPRIYDFCMTFVLCFMPLMMKLMVQHTGDTFPTLMNLDYLTNHISLKLSSFLRIERSVFLTTGILTRVDYLTINKFNLP